MVNEHLTQLLHKLHLSKYKTPFYFYDLDGIYKRAKDYKNAMGKRFDVHYAIKANHNISILKVIKSAGLGVDVVSGGEIRQALKAGFKGSHIIFSGVGKSHEDIQLAIRTRVKLLNVESTEELKRISDISKKLNKSVNIGLRLNPDVDADTHPYIKTGLDENKFGIDLDSLQEIKSILKNNPLLKLLSFSMHIGSQIKDLTAFQDAILKIIPLFQTWQKEFKNLKYFDIGGGLGVQYYSDDKYAPSIIDYSFAVNSALKNVKARFLCEPGRSIVAEFGALICTVEYIKKNKNKKFVIVNTGMHHLIRPALYQAHHEIITLKPLPMSYPTDTYDIVGPICESSDVIGKSRQLPEIKSGDQLAILTAGAYGMSMASQYNLHPMPKELAFKKGKIINI